MDNDIKAGQTWRTKEGLEIMCVIREVTATHVRYMVTSGEKPTWCHKREQFMGEWEKEPETT